MAKVKWLGEEPAVLPTFGGRLVQPGQVIEVPDADAASFNSGLWKAGKSED